MEKLENDARRIVKYINCHVPMDNCNLRCTYCYIRQNRTFYDKETEYPSPDYIRKAMSKKRMGGTCLITMCGGGETLLCKELPGIIEALVNEGHYIQIVTNGTISGAFDEILKRTMDFGHIFIKFSFHYAELKRLNMLELFAANFHKMRNAGCSVTAEMMAGDDLIPYIKEVKEFSAQSLGGWPHIAAPREDNTFKILTKLSMEDFYSIWSSFDSLLFEYKMKNIVYKKRTEDCKAGLWGLHMDLGTGNICQCVWHPHLDNIYDNIEQELRLAPVGNHCKLPYCVNGHAYILLGMIPEIEAPLYADIRNRIMPDGREWLTEEIKDVFSQKLYDNNRV